jgi:cytochrome c oxidase subunit 2
MSTSRGGGSALHAHGRGSHIIAREMWLQFGVGAAIFLLVIGLLLWIVLRRRDASAEEVADEHRPLRWLVLGGIVLPLVVLSTLFGWSVHDLVALAHPKTKEAAIVDVTAHRWWWEIGYPEEHVKTANEVVVPVGEAVRFRVRAADVIHTFWVPELGRKIDAFPHEWNTIWLEADRPGRYLGVCAEFCGLQHAHMQFVVRAVSPAAYRAWLRAAAQPARPPATAQERRGLAIFQTTSCAYCHTIAGTRAAGWVGPDLTHVASRPRLAAGTLPNTPAALRRWIAAPQDVKPGNLMPPAQLPADDLNALVTYLEALR